jgi:hypothetical protein
LPDFPLGTEWNAYGNQSYEDDSEGKLPVPESGLVDENMVENEKGRWEKGPSHNSDHSRQVKQQALQS